MYRVIVEVEVKVDAKNAIVASSLARRAVCRAIEFGNDIDNMDVFYVHDAEKIED